MAEKTTTPKPGITPPKGRPTRGRSERVGRRRVFGPVAQWIAVVLFLALLFVVLIVLTDGGDFNPFDDGTDTGSLVTVGAVVGGEVVGSLSST